MYERGCPNDESVKLCDVTFRNICIYARADVPKMYIAYSITWPKYICYGTEETEEIGPRKDEKDLMMWPFFPGHTLMVDGFSYYICVCNGFSVRLHRNRSYDINNNKLSRNPLAHFASYRL